jgi:hypothetical protein
MFLCAHLNLQLTVLWQPRIYYQFSPDRLPICPLTIHALLHIADSIEASGPVWASWAFPTERHCGSLIPAIKSHRFPFQSLDRYVIELAQLTQAKMQYNLEGLLSLQAPKGDVVGLFSTPACEFSLFEFYVFKFHIYYIFRSILCFTSSMHPDTSV